MCFFRFHFSMPPRGSGENNSLLLAGRMLLCVRERSLGDSHNHSSLQRQFSHGHNQKNEDGVSGNGTRVSHFLPTSRRIVQFSNGKVILHFLCMNSFIYAVVGIKLWVRGKASISVFW